MRRIGPAVAVLGLLTLTACGRDSSPTPDPTTPAASAPSTTAPAPSGSATGSPSPSPLPSWPVGCPSPAAAPAGATVVTATVAGGRVTTEKRRYDVARSSPVRLVVTTDAADEVHVHSYDVKVATTPGCPAVLDFQATIPASVEVELEKAHLHLFAIRAR